MRLRQAVPECQSCQAVVPLRGTAHCAGSLPSGPFLWALGCLFCSKSLTGIMIHKVLGAAPQGLTLQTRSHGRCWVCHPLYSPGSRCRGGVGTKGGDRLPWGRPSERVGALAQKPAHAWEEVMGEREVQHHGHRTATLDAPRASCTSVS